MAGDLRGRGVGGAALSTGVRVALTTAGDRDQARALARTLVEERLVACANVVGPVDSVYRWQGKVEEAAEVLLILKTTEARLPELEARLPELHPYEVPELVALAVDSGLGAYLDWISTSAASPHPR